MITRRIARPLCWRRIIQISALSTFDGRIVAYHGEVVTINNNTGLIESGNWNEYNLNPLTRIHWRASLVPAAAVIPAPIAYIKVAAVKKLVVGFLMLIFLSRCGYTCE